MPVCRSCKTKFSNRVKINNIVKVVNKRKFCIECSPYGAHNTSKDNPTAYKCKCGETDINKFSLSKRKICKKCQARYNTIRGQVTKQKVRDYLGGKCSNCQYDKYQVSLDIHHTKPEHKDPNFKTMRGWTWSRIVKELNTCVLLCRNCHAAYHVGLFDLSG